MPRSPQAALPVPERLLSPATLARLEALAPRWSLDHERREHRSLHEALEDRARRDGQSRRALHEALGCRERVPE